MKVSRAILLFSTLALLALGVAFAVWLAPRFRTEAVTLPDGTTIEFLGTGVGGATFSTEKPWEKFARRHLPWRFQKWMRPALSLSCSSGSNSVTAYFLLTTPGGGPMTRIPWEGHRVGDGRGEWFARQGGSCSSGGGPMLHGLVFRAHHRRQPEFIVQFLGQKDAVIAEFKVPNPVRGPFPEWQAVPLPQTRTNGPVSLTLRAANRAGRDDYPYLKADWEVVSDDPLWKNARPGWIAASDATGNSGPYLSPREPAWKLSTQLHRQEAKDFTDEEKRSFQALTPLKETEVRTLIETQTVAGVTVNHLLLVAPGRLSRTNGQPFFLEPGTFGSGSGSSSTGASIHRYWNSDTPALFFEIRGLGDHDEVRFQITGSDGRKIELEDSGTSWEQDLRTGYRRFPPAELPETFNLELIVSRPLSFEFMIDPREIRGAVQKNP